MTHAINWFEIPAADLDRAVTFYEAVLDVRLKKENFGGMAIAVMPTGETDVGGAIVLDSRRKPSTDGSLVYLNVAKKLDASLARVAKARGEVIVPKTDIGAPGFIAIIRDSEGNHVGLHDPR
jgi:predicted enzyme related to lactoylglutathione lyase